MTEDMRLKEVVGQAMVVPQHNLRCHNKLKDERNSNEIGSQGEENFKNHFLFQWSNTNANEYGTTQDKTFFNSGINFNNNISIDKNPERPVSCSPSVSSSPDDSYGDYEGQSSSSLDVSPQGDEYHCFSQEDVTDSDFSDDGNRFSSGSFPNQGITNPNYPGFQDFANEFEGDSSDDEIGNINNNNHYKGSPANDSSTSNSNNSTSNNYNNNNNNNGIEISDSVNHLDSVENFQKAFYDKPKFYIGHCDDCENVIGKKEENCVFDFSQKDVVDSGVCSNVTTDNEFEFQESNTNWFIQEDVVSTALYPVSGVFETTVLTDDDSDLTPSPVDDVSVTPESKKEEDIAIDEKMASLTWEESYRKKYAEESNEKIGNMPYKNDSIDESFRDSNKMEELSDKFYKETENEVVKKKEKTQINATTKKNQKVTEIVHHRGHKERLRINSKNRRSLPLTKERMSSLDLGFFDVYNIETAMPKIDLDVIESHLKAAKEEERRRRNDREEIRRRLAMGSDGDDYYGGERLGRKPSLQTRLQSGMNLQICFMNETMSDNESPNSDSEIGNSANGTIKNETDKNIAKRPDTLAVNKCHFSSILPNHTRPSTSLLTLPLKKDNELKPRPLTEADFFACQAQLQAEARLALSQAKEMARMQMEVERQRLQTSPITEMVRCSLEKVGVSFPQDRRRLSRQILTEMNVAQLQVIVNDLHTQIETLNENLVKFLIDRDDLHMEQDSMLVDIEDLTRYLGAKEKPQEAPTVNLVNLNNNINQNKNRISVIDNATE